MFFFYIPSIKIFCDPAYEQCYRKLKANFFIHGRSEYQNMRTQGDLSLLSVFSLVVNILVLNEKNGSPDKTMCFHTSIEKMC